MCINYSVSLAPYVLIEDWDITSVIKSIHRFSQSMLSREYGKVREKV